MNPPLALPPGMLDAARAAYASPPRAYHHFGHVEAVLGHFDEVDRGPGWARPREAWLAILYHDAVYVPGRRDNEARSAEFAVAEIARWMPGAGVDSARVADLIALTARHGSLSPADLGEGADGEDRRNLLDCDMAILGAAPAAFDAYDRAIAEEFRGVVPHWLYRIQRRRFLRGLLRRERIYLGDFFHRRLDAAARANLRRALDG